LFIGLFIVKKEAEKESKESTYTYSVVLASRLGTIAALLKRLLGLLGMTFSQDI
jgi:hypothetical protein